MEQTHDYLYAYRGMFTDGAVCRIRIYEERGQTPVVIASELPENQNTSVTNMAEYLAAEILRKHFRHRLEEEEPVVWIEHYPRPKERYMRRIVGKKEYDRVTFSSWVPRPVFRGGVWRFTLGEPHWRHLDPHDVVSLLGVDPDPDDHLPDEHVHG